MRKLNIVFTSLNNTIIADGSRILSAKLRAMGHNVKFVCLTLDSKEDYPEEVLRQFSELMGQLEADVACYSFLSDAFLRAAKVSTRIYADHPDVLQIWGGVHCTIAPEQAIKYCKIVCQGEGDEALPEIVDRIANDQPYHDVANFWFRDDEGTVTHNEMRPLLLDLDSNPWPDYEMEHQYILDDSRIKPMTMALMEKYHTTAPLGVPTYLVLSSRGCAFRCTFCYNATYKTLFAGQKSVRFRNLKDVVDELRFMKDRFSFFQSFFFSDDDFYLRSKKQLREFAEYAKEKIPDLCYGSWWGSTATPASLDKVKLDMMYEIGYRVASVGVQTGSEEYNKTVYDRDFPNKLFLEKAWMIDEHYGRKMVVLNDMIMHGPGETDADVLQTVKLIIEMPNWFSLSVFTFVFYPGSPLYKKALAAGEITDDPLLYNAKTFQPFERKGNSYIQHLMILMGCANYITPMWLKTLLVSRPMLWLGERIPQPMLDMWDWKKRYYKWWAYNQSRMLGIAQPFWTRWVNVFKGFKPSLPAADSKVLDTRQEYDHWSKGQLDEEGSSTR